MSRSGEWLADLCRQLAAPTEKFMKLVEADTIMVRGNSGTSVAYAMHVLFPGRFQWVVARKAEEQSASHGELFEPLSSVRVQVTKYVILDDFVASGRTVAGIVQDVAGGADCVGLVLYEPGKDSGAPFRLTKKTLDVGGQYDTLTR